jgi:hypothetical protein
VQREEAKRDHYNLCKPALFRVYTEEEASFELITKKD